MHTKEISGIFNFPKIDHIVLIYCGKHPSREERWFHKLLMCCNWFFSPPHLSMFSNYGVKIFDIDLWWEYFFRVSHEMVLTGRMLPSMTLQRNKLLHTHLFNSGDLWLLVQTLNPDFQFPGYPQQILIQQRGSNGLCL